MRWIECMKIICHRWVEEEIAQLENGLWSFKFQVMLMWDSFVFYFVFNVGACSVSCSCWKNWCYIKGYRFLSFYYYYYYYVVIGTEYIDYIHSNKMSKREKKLWKIKQCVDIYCKICLKIKVLSLLINLFFFHTLDVCVVFVCVIVYACLFVLYLFVLVETHSDCIATRVFWRF